MFLNKSVLSLLFLFLIQCCYGDKECTLSDMTLQQYKKGQYTFYVGQQLEKTNTSHFSGKNYYVVTELPYYSYCLGFITETLDSIILDCREQQLEKTGCFKVLTPKFNSQNNTVFFAEKEERICVIKVDDSCIGLNIQDNIKITIDCYNRDYYYSPRYGAPGGSFNAVPPRS